MLICLTVELNIRHVKWVTRAWKYFCLCHYSTLVRDGLPGGWLCWSFSDLLHSWFDFPCDILRFYAVAQNMLLICSDLSCKHFFFSSIEAQRPAHQCALPTPVHYLWMMVPCFVRLPESEMTQLFSVNLPYNSWLLGFGIHCYLSYMWILF